MLSLKHATRRAARPVPKPSHNPINCRAALRSLVVDGGLGAVIGDDVGDQPRRLGLARIGADDVVSIGRLGPALANAIDAEGLALDLRADSAREDIGEDEAGGGMAVRRREAAGAVTTSMTVRVLPGTLGSFSLKSVFTVSPSPVEAARSGGSAASASPAATTRPAVTARPANAFAVRRATRPTPLASPLPHRRGSGVRGARVAVWEHSRQPAPDLLRNRPNAQPS